MFAYCWASGQIEIGKTIPEGALPIARGREKKLKDVISGTARLAYNNKTWLVPGIPEAKDQLEALRALQRWAIWTAPSFLKANCKPSIGGA